VCRCNNFENWRSDGMWWVTFPDPPCIIRVHVRVGCKLGAKLSVMTGTLCRTGTAWLAPWVVRYYGLVWSIVVIRHAAQTHCHCVLRCHGDGRWRSCRSRSYAQRRWVPYNYCCYSLSSVNIIPREMKTRCPAVAGKADRNPHSRRSMQKLCRIHFAMLRDRDRKVRVRIRISVRVRVNSVQITARNSHSSRKTNPNPTRIRNPYS